MRPIRVLAILLLALLGLSASPRVVRAQTFNCSLSSPTLAFGTINVLSGSPSYASGSLSANCVSTYPVAITAYVCLSIGSGSGGGSSTARMLSSGGATLPVQLKQTAGSPTEIGDGTSNLQDGPLSFTVPANGSGGVSFPITGIIPAQGVLPTPGTYASVFSGTQFQAIGSITPSSTCAQVTSTQVAVYTSTLTVSATVAPQCTVAATPMNFPTTSLLTTALQATSTITVTCNAVSTAVVGLDNGSYGSGPTTRQMAFGTHRVTYGIYQDSSRTVPWGNVAGSSTKSLGVTATASASATAYGQVAPQSGNPPGTYVDVVNVVVNY